MTALTLTALGARCLTVTRVSAASALTRSPPVMSARMT
eukprot:CAMPEP_0205959340 /NCGR_PEP_ID=MMETSP1459-20131121/55323_1 /ASSEMBLY_ACC=CAM_ASM_001120 /TAXON_ID=41880 /ORGANISM="Pycnococcus provasolii, Strain RCC931" /LENGTH=37 /DNA_ID= /DNA_START= /DNA_END= /DNA_ORIENTATION=